MSSTSASTSSQRGKLLAVKKIPAPQSNPAAAPKSLQALVCLDLPCENRENARLFGTLGSCKRLWLRSSVG